MIAIKDAVISASKFIMELFPDAKGLRLEQVEMSGPGWQVVMSFTLGEPSSLALVIGQSNRLFKEVAISDTTGEALGLRMWKV
jgi:hypothetical protein